MIIVKDWLFRLTGTTTARGAAIFTVACASFLLAGCTTIPASLEDRAGIQRVTVVPDTVPPKTHFETYAVGAGAGMGKGQRGQLAVHLVVALVGVVMVWVYW